MYSASENSVYRTFWGTQGFRPRPGGVDRVDITKGEDVEAASLMRFTRRGTIKLMSYSAAWAGQRRIGSRTTMV